MITTLSLQETELEEFLDKTLLPPTDSNAEVQEIPGYKLVYVNGACPRNGIKMMKLYATSIPQALPSWATVISNNAGLIEVEIDDEDPSFHSIIEELSTEIEPGVVGVKASDLCTRLSIEMVDSNEEN